MRVKKSIFILGCSLLMAQCGPADPTSGVEDPILKERLIPVSVEVGPLAIDSLYLSGEGPGRIQDISVSELIANGHTVWSEPPQGSGPAIAEKSQSAHQAASEDRNRLYWCRRATLEIIDEDGKPLSHPDFLCHSLISFSAMQHWNYFPHSSGISEGFLFNFSQGITDVALPDNYALPFNSSERLRFEFKSLNRTANQPRRIKCRWTLYFVADKDLTHPVRAANLFHSGVAVLVGGVKSKNRMLPAGCGGMCGMKHMSKAKDAPNDVLHRKLNTPFDRNAKGEEITWHWVIPPGRHSYQTMHPEHHFDDEGPIIAAGAHVHPFCEKISMIEERHGQPDKTVFTIYSKTSTSQGIRIEHIDYLTWPTTGISLDKGADYGWDVTYNNTSGVDQDAMAGVTLYFADQKFEKPTWAL